MSLSCAWADSEVQKWARTMKVLGLQAFPEAVAETLNQSARQMVHDVKGNANDSMIVRTTYTTNSIRQDRHAKGGNIDRMYSRAANRSPYLPLHDEGETVYAKHSKLPIPTMAARAGNLKRAILPRYRMNSLGSVKGNSRFFMGKPKGGARPSGIWERHSGNKKLRLVRRLSVSSAKIPRTDYFTDAHKENTKPSKMQKRFVTNAKIIFSDALRGAR
jgi:hypothetical protein